jgi:hypothetical protein
MEGIRPELPTYCLTHKFREDWPWFWDVDCICMHYTLPVAVCFLHAVRRTVIPDNNKKVKYELCRVQHRPPPKLTAGIYSKCWMCVMRAMRCDACDACDACDDFGPKLSHFDAREASCTIDDESHCWWHIQCDSHAKSVFDESHTHTLFVYTLCFSHG